MKPVNLKEIDSEYSLERTMLQLKLQYFGPLTPDDSLERPDAGKTAGEGATKR